MAILLTVRAIPLMAAAQRPGPFCGNRQGAVFPQTVSNDHEVLMKMVDDICSCRGRLMAREREALPFLKETMQFHRPSYLGLET